MSFLGLPLPPGFEGRPLLEAFDAGPEPRDVSWRTDVQQAGRRSGAGMIQHRMENALVGSATYVSAIGRAEDFGT
jgi:hypothetical protein